MQEITYELSSIKISRIKNTHFAFSLDAQEEQSITIFRFYEISDDELTYTKIGMKTSPIRLYAAMKAHRKIIEGIIRNFLSINPKYRHLLKEIDYYAIPNKRS